MIVKELFAKLGLEMDESSFKAGEAALHGLSFGLAAVGAVVAGVAGGIAHMVREVAESTVEAGRAAQRAGITQDAFEKLSFVADATGVSAQDMATGLTRLARTVYAASTGSQDAHLTFSKLGIAFRDATGKLKPADALFGDVAERFKKMPDGVEKTALAMHLFGRGGAALIPILNKGRKEIEELEATAASFGLVTGPELREESERLEKSQKLLGAAFRGLKIAIAGPLLKYAGQFTTTVSEWIRLNREWIATGIGDAFEWVRARLADLIQLLSPTLELIRAIFIDTGAWRYALIALATAIAVLAVVSYSWLAPLLLMLAAIEELKAIYEGRFDDTLLSRLFPKDVLIFIRDTLRDIVDAWKFITTGGIADMIEKFRKSRSAESLVVGSMGSNGVALDPMGNRMELAPSPGGGFVRAGRADVKITQTINSNHGESAKDIGDRSADAISDGLLEAMAVVQ
jgi:hypothetical protein